MDRVLSAYEFSTEVACRSLAVSQPRKRDARATDTRNVWPWSGLVPWLEDEVQTRNRAPGAASVSVEDPYNSPLIVPLAEWIEHPLVQEHIHNGQTLQVGSPGMPCLQDPYSWYQAQACDLIITETIGSAGLDVAAAWLSVCLPNPLSPSID